ncbi:hypothetical protein [Corynebacterium sp. A21]|uniref:hypothetical protein n=1 Tax=Corynebacterium sp. A21 TaxID=3457318 RepID=UPI003FD3158C
MSLFVKELLNSKNIHPSAEELKVLSARWEMLQRQRGDLAGINLADADIALKNIAGGDHLEH